jgi:hypothetical protein
MNTSIPRGHRWVRASHSLTRYEIFMVPTVQSLGRFDEALAAKDALYVAGEGYLAADSDILNFNDHVTLSYLWVLGAYEVVRVIDQRERGNKTPGAAEINAVLRKFSRLRMPLAKFEAERRHQDTDAHIAYPALNAHCGVAWQVAEGTFISRGELADQFLSWLEGNY